MVKPVAKKRTTILASKPSGLLLFGLRMPIWLYRFHLGWVFGDRFLLLSHTGRRSGRTHQAVIEVVKHDRRSGAFFVVSGWGGKSDWYRNIHARPAVGVQSGRESFAACAEDVPVARSVEILKEYSYRHPTAFKELTSVFLGERLEPGERAAQRLAESMPMVVFRPRTQVLS